MITDFKTYIEAEAREILNAVSLDSIYDSERVFQETIGRAENNAAGLLIKLEQQIAC
jgi:hypothetical protein